MAATASEKAEAEAIQIKVGQRKDRAEAEPVEIKGGAKGDERRQ